jgi:hypothetical protein
VGTLLVVHFMVSGRQLLVLGVVLDTMSKDPDRLFVQIVT